MTTRPRLEAKRPLRVLQSATSPQKRVSQATSTTFNGATDAPLAAPSQSPVINDTTSLENNNDSLIQVAV